MASVLHVYANLLWRDPSLEARVKKVAALRLLGEPHFRLHLIELSSALVSMHGSAIPAESLLPSRLADVFANESCFVFSGETGNVLLDAASLMAAGKDCLRAQIDRVWKASSPLSWARNQLAWYIVSRQHIDMGPTDLFLARVDHAEDFLAAAWTARMDFHEQPDLPYTSLWQLLEGETRLELTSDRSAVRLNFNRLLHLHPQPQPQPQAEGHCARKPQPPAAQQQYEQSGAGAHRQGNGHEAAAPAAASDDWGQSDGGDDGGDGGTGPASGPGGRDEPEHNGYGYYGAAEEDWEYGDECEDEEGEDGEEDDEVQYAAPAPRGGKAAASHSGSAAVATAAPPRSAAAGGGVPARGPAVPLLRSDLLQQYVRAVFCGPSGGPVDQLMAVAAMGLVELGRNAGRQQQQQQQNAAEHAYWRAPPPGGIPDEPHRFSLPLPRLVTHVRDKAPRLLAGFGGGGGRSECALLLLRLQERPGRGCFRLVVSQEVEAGGSGGREEGGEVDCGAVVELDMEVLRDRAVQALQDAAATVFTGSRPVDRIRRTAAVQLASRTRAFAGRVHCARLRTLAHELGQQLPVEVFSPTRLSGFERLVGAESSANVMHVFRKQLPGGGLAGRGHGGEDGENCVTLNVGKLLAAAGIRQVTGYTARGAGGSGGTARVETGGNCGGGGAGWGVRGAATEANPRTSSATNSARDPPPPPSSLHHNHAAAAPAAAGASGGSLPPPPSDAALRQAVEALFPGPNGGGRGGGGGEHLAAAAATRRTAALSLVKALHSQPGGFLPLSRLADIVGATVPGAPELEPLLAADPEFFEIQETWQGGPRSVRLRASAAMARAAEAANGASSNGSSHTTAAPSAASDSPLPRRPHAPNCPYYMRTGTCKYKSHCKYNHPPLATQRQEPNKATAAAVAAASAAATAAAPPQHTRGPGATVATASYQPYQQPPQPPHLQAHSQNAAPRGTPPEALPPALLSPSASLAEPAAGDTSAAAAAAGAVSRSAAHTGTSSTDASSSASAPEVKVVTTACTPDHLDMLQHCYAAPQVAVACKVRPSVVHHRPGHHPPQLGEPGTVCFVQLYAPAVAAAGGGGGSAGSGSGSGSAGTTHGSAVPGSGSSPRWPATVYLVDLVSGEDRAGMLLPSLSPILSDPAVPKVIYCSSEVVPYMSRISPLHDISVLHTLVARAPAALMGLGVAEAEAISEMPPLATLLQQLGTVSAAGVAALTAVPPHSPLWTSRPLAPELRHQAVLEVVHLAAVWGVLMGRLKALPQQLSQMAADRLLGRGYTAQPASAAAAATANLVGSGAMVRSANHAVATVAVPGVTMVVPAGAVLTSVGSGVPPRGRASMHRVRW